MRAVWLCGFAVSLARLGVYLVLALRACRCVCVCLFVCLSLSLSLCVSVRLCFCPNVAARALSCVCVHECILYVIVCECYRGLQHVSFLDEFLEWISPWHRLSLDVHMCFLVFGWSIVRGRLSLYLCGRPIRCFIVSKRVSGPCSLRIFPHRLDLTKPAPRR